MCIIRVLMKRFIFILFLSCLSDGTALADVVKPALVEINVDQDRSLQIELRASIEALLTGINAQYKNTQDAPNADEYDDYRKMTPEALMQAFNDFKEQLENHFLLVLFLLLAVPRLLFHGDD